MSLSDAGVRPSASSRVDRPAEQRARDACLCALDRA